MRNTRGQVIAIILIAALVAAGLPLLVKAATGAPSIPHAIAGREQCLTCHNLTGASPVPASHTTFNESSCLSCHSASAATAPAVEPSCIGCHSQPELSINITSGETLSLFVDRAVFDASIHGDKLLCTDCHSTVTDFPHSAREIPTLREYSITQYEMCKKCHFDNYTKTLDSVHYDKLTQGDTGTPLCTDCHGVHNITLPSQPRTRISLTCSECHQNIYDMYAGSVHGKALISENNYDVPVCTDCHLSHTIEDPRTAGFRIKSVDLCVSCHSNEKLMQKYGISTEVVKSYLQDFHGASVALLASQSKDVWPQEAVCTDCHGVHDIKKPDDLNSAVIKANLVNTCRSCHPDASVNFPGAWLSHYEPSVDKAPLVFYVRWFYRILIPFILVGLIIHILLDLWRVVTNR